MQTNQDSSIQDLQKCTVAIQRRDKSGIRGGTGVIVTNDGIILTCYHVVGNLKRKTIDFKDVDIYFPSAPDIKGHANVLEDYSDASIDIALLQLRGKLPEQVAVANLSETIDPTHTFRSFGYRKEKAFDGLYADGIIQGKVRKKFKEDNDNISLQEVIQLRSDGIDHGMSGAAVFDTKLNRVVGIISEHLATSSNVDKNLALAIPIESIIKVYPELTQKNPGLKILEFLRKIGLEESGIWYQRIDDLYVPPVEYEEINEALRKDRIVFITGPREYGKTYTSIRLLWEYYNKGYIPKYIQTREEEKGKVRERLAAIESELKPQCVVYFEDPFGKVKYQHDKDLEREIGAIIDTVTNSEDTYVIITSREEVFQEFEDHSIAELDLKTFERKLNIKTPSYDYNKRKEILLKCAQVMNCKWLEDETLTNFVLESIKDETKLPTPLNIKDFANATRKTAAREELLSKVNAKSKETEKSFGEEIKEMSNFKILFLSFPFISDSFSVDFVKTKYQELLNDQGLVKKIRIEEDPWEFDRVSDWFKDTKIDITSTKIRFSHPSYSEAIKYIISDHGSLTKMGKVLSEVLLKLDDKDETTAIGISSTVSMNYDKLPEDVQKLLFKLADNKETAVYVAWGISNNFEELPDKVRDELLIKLAGYTNQTWSDNLIWTISNAIIFNYNQLPSKVQNLLFKIAETETGSRSIANIIILNYNQLPSKVQNLLFKIAENDNYDIRYSIITALISYHYRPSTFNKLPHNIESELLKRIYRERRGSG